MAGGTNFAPKTKMCTFSQTILKKIRSQFRPCNDLPACPGCNQLLPSMAAESSNPTVSMNLISETEIGWMDG